MNIKSSDSIFGITYSHLEEIIKSNPIPAISKNTKESLLDDTLLYKSGLIT
jgi:hypothetical protein